MKGFLRRKTKINADLTVESRNIRKLLENLEIVLTKSCAHRIQKIAEELLCLVAYYAEAAGLQSVRH